MKVRFYGKLADRCGRERTVTLPLPGTVCDLRAQLAVDVPKAAEELDAQTVRACIGDRLVGDDHPLRPDDVVEFLAPVSGG